MPKFSAFNSTRFSSRPSHAQRIYEELIANLGGEENYSTDFNSPAMARLYATAMVLGAVKEALERAGSQFRPSRALELLPAYEAEYGLKPEPDATISERRADFAAAARIARGATRGNIETILTELLGEDFVAYVTTPKEDAVNNTATPAAVGVYCLPGTERSVFRLVQPVTTLGSPVTVTYAAVIGASQVLKAGDKIAIDAGNHGRCEAVTITAATDSTLTATFTKPHSSGVLLATGRFPYLVGSQRHNLFTLTPEAALSTRTRRRANRAIQRLLRGVSTWSLSDDSGPFRVGVGRLGITTIG